MIGRRTWIVCWLATLSVSAESAAVILTRWPKHGWGPAFAHAPELMRAYLAWWLGPPVGTVIVLLAALFWELWLRGKTVSPGQLRWMRGVLIGGTAVQVFLEAIHLVGLFASKAQRAAYVAAGGDAHKFHFDPDFIITRLGVAASALFIVWFANRMPKLLIQVVRQPGWEAWEEWARISPRFGGWLFTIVGVVGFGCVFLQPISRALMIYAAVTSAGLVIWIAAALIYRFVGPSTPKASRS